MKRLIFPLLIFLTTTISAQDLSSARKIVDTLASPVLWGRGYTKKGMAKAADYISHEFKKIGLKPLLGTDYKQRYTYPVNTFPGKMEVTINGKKLTPGKDYIIEPSSSGLQKKAHLEQMDSITFISREQHLIVIMQNKLTWSVAKKAENYTAIQVSKEALTSKPDTIDLDIENTFIPEFKASNICGIVTGTRQPDSILMITAHYDHLGGMGADTYFPGANDNASGIAMLLSLAKYYAANPQHYSIAFVCFSGEEPGLLGSAYFTEHPIIPLEKIRFLINLDMVGTGEKGITVVNATLYPKEFTLLTQLNNRQKYLPSINSRGPTANSDHYLFTQKGVPAFFIYTQGGISAYHDVFDLSATLPLTEFTDLYKLFIDFNAMLMKPS